MSRGPIFREIQERGVGDDGTLDNVVECEVKSVTTAEAVTCGPKLGNAFSFERSNDLVEWGASDLGAMGGKPSPEVECFILRSVHGSELGMLISEWHQPRRNLGSIPYQREDHRR